MDYSIIVLLQDENAELLDFISDLNNFFGEIGKSFEILIVSSGIVSFSEKMKKQLAAINSGLRIYQLPQKTTEALSLSVAFKESCGETIVVYGSFQQVSTRSLKKMMDALDDNADLVTPYRQHRRDSRFNQFQSKIYNMLVKACVKTELKDIGCKVKVLKRRVLEEIDLYGNMFSFLPILARGRGFRIKEVNCDHYKDHHQPGLRRINLYFTYLLNILTLFFNARFNRKPLRFYSAVGLIFMVLGVFVFSYVIVEKIFFGIFIGERLELILSLLFAVLGIQAASVGLLGEIIAFVYGRHRKEYTVEKVL